MPNILYLLVAVALLVLVLPRIRRRKKPFDWSRRHTWWSRWRARGAFPNRR